jgi:hypothetical protein
MFVVQTVLTERRHAVAIRSLDAIISGQGSAMVSSVEVKGLGKHVVMSSRDGCEALTAAFARARLDAAGGGEGYTMTITMSDGGQWTNVCFVESGCINLNLHAKMDAEESHSVTHRVLIDRAESEEWDMFFDVVLKPSQLRPNGQYADSAIHILGNGRLRLSKCSER